MDENDPLFTRYCNALYALHCSLRDAAAGRERESPTYATTLGERRRVREALADLADAMNARGMSAAQFVGSVRASIQRPARFRTSSPPAMSSPERMVNPP